MADVALARRAAAAGVVLAALAGCGSGSSAIDPAARRPPGQATPSSTAASASPAPGPGGAGADTRPSRSAEVEVDSVASPSRVSLPALDISSPLDRLGLDGDGVLQSPPRWQVAGWYAGGPRPGETGPAVIAGHVDSPTGPAVFARLAELAEGDTVRVTRSDGTTVTFRVDRTERADQDDFPTDAVYGPTPDAQLRLITCDGPYLESQGGYQDNLIVYATEVDS